MRMSSQTNESGEIVGFSKEYSRQKSVMYMLMWWMSNRIGYPKYLGRDVRFRIFLYENETGKTAVWFGSEEAETIENEIVRRSESREFIDSLSDDLSYYWGMIEPFLSELKELGSVRDFHFYYDALTRFWAAMDVAYSIINRPDSDKDVSGRFLEYRRSSEQYTGKMDAIMIAFWSKVLSGRLADMIPFMSVEELERLHASETPDSFLGIIEGRRNGYFIFDGDIFFASELDTFLSSNGFALERHDKDGRKTFGGMTGYPGKVTGKVRKIISHQDVRSFLDGEILVAEMTFPDHVSIMKRAKAFVTDEGGVTCHAAITARELKKPCVIGTKIATQVLKDGDLVEVDADRGVVRVLKRET